jgi:hypothetical protein
MANQGLWELARFDRQLERAGFDDPDPPVVAVDFINEYTTKTIDFLASLRELVGDATRIRWRQMHTPTVSNGPYFVDPAGEKKKNRDRFHALKIRQMNEVAREIMMQVTEAEFSRRGGRRVDGESGSISVWPIGDIVSPWPTELWLADDIHPSSKIGGMVWGDGVLEYLARSPMR